MAYFARPFIQMARTRWRHRRPALLRGGATALRAPVMLAAARCSASPAAFVRAMGGGGGFIDAAGPRRHHRRRLNFEKVRPADLLLRVLRFFGVEKIPAPPLPFLPEGVLLLHRGEAAVPEPLVAAMRERFFLRIASTNSSSFFLLQSAIYPSVHPSTSTIPRWSVH